jgi:2-phospho-L-lactate transferase/gluconeogenesis factor (CofD/UPF0052 family)
LRLKVVLFSGGRGTSSIASALIEHGQMDLTSIVNAYDDGLSTGRIRAFVPGMLGPSDIRKNISTFMPNDERAQRALRRFLDYRFPPGTKRDDALRNMLALIDPSQPPPDETLNLAFEQLTVGQILKLRQYCSAYLDYEKERSKAGSNFDYGDCAVGNILFAGAFISNGHDFNAATADMQNLCEVRARVLNITLGQNYVLLGLKEDGRILPDEASIVSPQDHIPVERIFLLDEYLKADELEQLEASDFTQRLEYLKSKARLPEPNPEVLTAIAESDVIIYGPGTQHSSLFPSYLTKGVAEALAANTAAEKIFVANISPDHDIRSESAESLLEKFELYMNRYAEGPIPLRNLITRAFLQQQDLASDHAYVPFDISARRFEGSAVVARNWEAESGRHLGGFILDELLSILRSARAVELQSYRHMVSIVVPVLDEERTIAEVIRSLIELDISDLEIEKEIIVVDGGSTDRTREIVGEHKNIRLYRLENVVGRGAAIRLGFSKARGDLVLVFPGDGEYSVSDIAPVIRPILNDQFKAVIGSRSIKCLNLESRIRHIYGDNRALYSVSKYGGMLLSVLCLIIYNRYISDVLSTLKAFDRSFLESLQLVSNGVDLECEMIAKISNKQGYIIEVPVNYTPRTQADGKKITIKDGLRAILALFRFRGWRGAELRRTQR